jgi:hypothetical protein
MLSERDQRTVDAEDVRAQQAGLIGPDGLRYASASGHRSMIRVRPTSRTRCGCGCGQRDTHVGLGDGLAMTSGCEMYVRRWVRDGYTDVESGDSDA